MLCRVTWVQQSRGLKCKTNRCCTFIYTRLILQCNIWLKCQAAGHEPELANIKKLALSLDNLTGGSAVHGWAVQVLSRELLVGYLHSSSLRNWFTLLTPIPRRLFPGVTHQLAEAVQANVLVSLAVVAFGAMRLSTPHLACQLSNALQFQTLTQNDNCKLRL